MTKNRVLAAFMLLMAPVAVARIAVAAAPAAGGPTHPTVLPPQFGDPMSLSLKNARMDNIFKTFERILGVPVEFDPELGDRLLTLELQDIRAQTVLTVVCETIGCSWDVVEGKLLVRATPSAADEQRGPHSPRLDTPLSLDLDGSEIAVVLRLCAESIGVPLRLRGDAASAGSLISVHLADRPAIEALDAVCKGLCDWSLVGRDPETTYLEVRLFPGSGAKR